MTDCPPRLRGDLSKWLCEINTGVYVGNVSGRVRDAIWERVCQNLKNGRATMVFSTNGEQKMDFRVHNTTWTPVDFDGIQLMRRPLPQSAQTESPLKPGFSNAAKRQMAQRTKRAAGMPLESYVIIDLETTGLQNGADQILEFGAIRVLNGECHACFSQLVRTEKVLPQAIADLTGISQAMLEKEGVPLSEALPAFLDFIGTEQLIGYNLTFDMAFLRTSCKAHGKPLPQNRCLDLLSLARRKIFGVPNYKLATLTSHLSLEGQTPHRALADCRLLHALYLKLNEI